MIVILFIIVKKRIFLLSLQFMIYQELLNRRDFIEKQFERSNNIFLFIKDPPFVFAYSNAYLYIYSKLISCSQFLKLVINLSPSSKLSQQSPPHQLPFKSIPNTPPTSLTLQYSSYIMTQPDSITTHRITRLSQNKCLLGQPDIISIRQVRLSPSFFNKDRKYQDAQQNYINGLIFPTTAHFSSFISTRYKGKDPSKITIKAKLLMFDAFQQKDIHIEISIPGSLESKAYNLKGQPLSFNTQDYERAYYSSFLRSLYPMNYPNIILYPLLNRLEILKPIIRNFIAFSYRNQLREMDYDFDIYRNCGIQERSYSHNLGVQILIGYCIQNKFDVLLKLILDEVKKVSPLKAYQTEMEMGFLEKKYGKIIGKTAQKLLLHGHASKLKEYQIRALHQFKKFNEISFIGRSLIQTGGTTEQISKIILNSLIELRQDKRFLKTLNLISNLHNMNQKKVGQVSHQDLNPSIFQLQTYVTTSKAISEYPQLCFPFDNTFFNRLADYNTQKKLLVKNTKEGFTVSILEKVQESLANSPIFYDSLVVYEKKREWKNLLKFRAECFWLESDFTSYEENMKATNSSTFNDNYSFFDEKFEDAESEEEEEQNRQEYSPQKKIAQKDSPQKKQNNEQLQQSFDGNLSQHEEQKDIVELPKCSTRINTTRKLLPQKKIQSKILCGLHLQKLFVLLFSDIKLQNSLQSWQQKLKDVDSGTFSQSKKQLAGMIFLKKGFLHKKLQRNKKCEQSFKLARKLSQSNGVNLVATYQLILLFIDNKNVKGVEFYLVELIKLMKILGVQQFDIVPEWAKPIIQFVIDHEGLSIVKNVHFLFRNVFSLFLRSNYSEQQTEGWTQLQKQNK